MDAWTFIWLMFLLKIPIVALFLIVRWAVRQTPDAAPGTDGGIGPHLRPLYPHHPRSPLPRLSRRGPHGGPRIQWPLGGGSTALAWRLPQTSLGGAKPVRQGRPTRQPVGRGGARPRPLPCGAPARPTSF